MVRTGNLPIPFSGSHGPGIDDANCVSVLMQYAMGNFRIAGDHPQCRLRDGTHIGRLAAGLYSAGIQVLSGLYSDIASATLAVSWPRSFSNTLPSWLMMKVITPDVRYTAG